MDCVAINFRGQYFLVLFMFKVISEPLASNEIAKINIISKNISCHWLQMNTTCSEIAVKLASSKKKKKVVKMMYL